MRPHSRFHRDRFHRQPAHHDALTGGGPELPDERPRGRPRSLVADRAIVEAVLEELIESGIDGLSLEQVAARAGVAKATIYRRWANKEALVLDALTTVDEPLPDLPGTSVRDDLVVLVDSIR